MSARSDFPCPAIRTSGMRPIKSMADGLVYSDRNEYDRSLKNQGLRIFEDGEKQSKREEPSIRKIVESEMKKHV